MTFRAEYWDQISDTIIQYKKYRYPIHVYCTKFLFCKTHKGAEKIRRKICPTKWNFENGNFKNFFSVKYIPIKRPSRIWSYFRSVMHNIANIWVKTSLFPIEINRKWKSFFEHCSPRLYGKPLPLVMRIHDTNVLAKWGSV